MIPLTPRDGRNPPPNATIYPVKVREDNVSLRCIVQSVVGYRASCRCGWRSQTQKNVQAARYALEVHRAARCERKPEAAQATSETAA